MKANKQIRSLEKDKAGYAQVVGGLVALLLTIIIGVLVFWQVSGAITMTSDAANASKNQTTTMASTVFGILPIVALVVVAGVILGIILGFGGGSKNE